ncbi:uncharacterized protein LOC132205941 [Neocloeon triangulifer]|uniref:uncharacterized protein LOC132205941 n=1 Tax=Neocloeon triangulifer TaxID=2078957 RepID=UPI00286F8669|nr:uncharacterized protein LOC132205941 [Neocloeon triangulifer]
MNTNNQHFCLRWNNYQANMTSVFHQLLTDEAFVDVTLACNEETLKAHKVVLSACSPYFQKLLLDNPCKHPVIILPQEVSFLDLQFIIDFVYRGEVDVSQEELQSLLRTAEQLKIKGLCDVAAREMGHRGHAKVKYSTFKRKLHEPEPIEYYKSSNSEMDDEYEDDDVDVEDDYEDDMEPKNYSRKEPLIDVNANSTQQKSHEPPISRLDDPPPLKPKEENHQQAMMITPELLGLIPTSALNNLHSKTVSSENELTSTHKTTKHWTQEDMELALEALRSQTMNLTKASATYGIPSTTLWQRAHRLGINTPKKDNAAKTWSEADLEVALKELRAGRISANRASKQYNIPSSTLYKIARKEGIKLSAPFNASPTSWNSDDLSRALEAIRRGASVQKAASEFGIPSGTLYGRCKREGIELCKNTPVPWSHTDMSEALEAVRVGDMSINQAAIHYNLPYSSLYGRFKRVKFDDNKMDYDVFTNCSSDPH